MADTITTHTRKRLWAKSGNSCAFTGCDQTLLQPNESGSEDTVVGIECHIVAQKDDPKVARAPCLLSKEEKARWAQLLEHRHALANLVLMCAVHSRVIDDVAQDFSVEQVVDMKNAHEEEVSQRQRATRSDIGAFGQGSVQIRAPILLEDVPAWQRRSVRALADVDVNALLWLNEQIGIPAEEDKIVELVRSWPNRLDQGPEELANLLAREAEAIGLWSASADVWERLAMRSEGPTRADRFARAAVDAGIGGEFERRERLLGQAETLDPESVRVKLERFDDRVDGAEQLKFLARLETNDPTLKSLIASQETLANLLLGKIEAAERSLARAQVLDADATAVRISRINLEVQRARIALSEDKTFLMAHLLDALDQAMELREELLVMGRWEESVRLLMMAADVPALLRDPDAAKAILEQARPEEIQARDGASVLGDAALRAGAPSLALLFIEGLEKDEGLRRIEATARAEISSVGRKQALRELEELAFGGGAEAEASAMARLILCMPPILADWNESVAGILDGSAFDRHVQSLRILDLARRDPVSAKRLAQELPRVTWADEIRLRVAGASGDEKEIERAATAFLERAPDASGRLLVARAFAQVRETGRAGEIGAGIAQDPNAAPRIRNDAFHVWMKTLADRGCWVEAEQTWKIWRDLSFRELRPPDGRVSAWQARVLHNRRRGERGS